MIWKSSKKFFKIGYTRQKVTPAVSSAWPRVYWLSSTICVLIHQRYQGINNSGAPAAPRAAKRSPIVIMGKKRKPMKDFLMVIMASGIARGRVRTTTTTESCNMAAILQKIGWQRHTALVYRVLLWYWPSPLCSIDTCQNNLSADQYHVTISRAQVYSSSRSRIFVKLTADQLLVFRLDRVLMWG